MTIYSIKTVGYGLVGVAVWLLAAASTHATVRTWIGGNANDDMSATNNWAGGVGVASNSYSDQALFTESAATKTPSNSAARSFGGFYFSNSVDWVMGGSATATIGSPGFASSGIGTNTIRPNIGVGEGSSWNIGPSNTLLLTGGITWGGISTHTLIGSGTMRITGTIQGPWNPPPTLDPRVTNGVLELGGSGSMREAFVKGNGVIRFIANNQFDDNSTYFLAVDENGRIDVNGYSDSFSGGLYVGAAFATNNGFGGNGGGRVDIGSGYLGTKSNVLKAATITTAASGTNAISVSLWCQAAATGSVVQGNLRMSVSNTNMPFIVDDGAAAVDFEVTGTVAEAPGNNNGVRKLGSGWMRLSGPGAYRRGVVVEAGTLEAAADTALGTGPVTNNGGALLVSTNVTVTNAIAFGSSGGTVGGGGAVTWPLVLSTHAVISPGMAGPGTFTTANQVWTNGGAYAWKIADATGGAGATNGFSSLVSTGTLTIASSAASPFTIQVLGLNATNSPGVVANFNRKQAYAWTVATSVNAIVGFDATKLTVDSSGFASNNPLDPNGTFRVVQASDGKSLQLLYSGSEKGTAVLVR